MESISCPQNPKFKGSLRNNLHPKILKAKTSSQTPVHVPMQIWHYHTLPTCDNSFVIETLQ